MKTLIVNPDYEGSDHASIELAKYASKLMPEAEVLKLYARYP